MVVVVSVSLAVAVLLEVARTIGGSGGDCVGIGGGSGRRHRIWGGAVVGCGRQAVGSGGGTGVRGPLIDIRVGGGAGPDSVAVLVCAPSPGCHWPLGCAIRARQSRRVGVGSVAIVGSCRTAT